MPYTDLPLDELRAYIPDHEPPPDLAAFWARTLEEARFQNLAATFIPVDTGLQLVDVWDVSFAGFGGSPVRAWFRAPHGATRRLPTVIEYVGYGGGRGLAHQDLLWAAAGFAYLIMDTGGQGATWGAGATADAQRAGEPQVDGVMTEGIGSPETYYYRRLMTDAVRAVEAAQAHPLVDASRI